MASKLSNDEWIKKLRSKNSDIDEYNIVDKYSNSRTPIRVEHRLCKTTYMVIPRDFMRGFYRCPTCYQNRRSLISRRSIQEVVNSVLSVLGDKYEVLECKFSTTFHSYLVTVKHLTCGRIYTTRADHITSDHRLCSCTRKTKSFGELRIKKYFDSKSIDYEYPKIFKDLFDVQPLHFDFYIPSYNLLIEYQGQQHYDKNHQISGGTIGWEKQQYHDKLKREYAKNHKFLLEEIPYYIKTQEEINEYLEQLIKQLQK